MHYTSGDVYAMIDERARARFREIGGTYTMTYMLTLEAGDTCAAAGTTKRGFTGPGKVRFTFHRDGSLQTAPEGATLTYLQKD